jgi:uncharacterized SAM-binding protein YcdF (DUF218 family)
MRPVPWGGARGTAESALSLARASRRPMSDEPRPARQVIVIILLLGVVGVLSWWAASGVGRWLVVDDPLERADAIVVLGGHVPFRAVEAGAIFGAGWAPEIWLTRGVSRAAKVATTRSGRDVPVGDEAASRKVLQQSGVPASAIRVVLPAARDTMEEMQVVAHELVRVGGHRVIIVTSKAHSRRARATWDAVTGSPSRAIVKYARSDPFDGTRWWQRTYEKALVRHELLGLANVWAGFPVRPDPSGLAAPVLR